jgi:hypothetical protein
MQWEDEGLVMLERCALLSQTETVQSALSADAKSL